MEGLDPSLVSNFSSFGLKLARQCVIVTLWRSRVSKMGAQNFKNRPAHSSNKPGGVGGGEAVSKKKKQGSHMK